MQQQEYEFLGEAAKRVGLSMRRAAQVCKDHNWPGAKKEDESKPNSPWMVPKGSKPVRKARFGPKSYREHEGGDRSLVPEVVRLKGEGLRNIDIAHKLKVDPSFVTHTLRRVRERESQVA